MADVSIPQSRSYNRITVRSEDAPYDMYVNNVPMPELGKEIASLQSRGLEITKIEQIVVDVHVHDVTEILDLIPKEV